MRAIRWAGTILALVACVACKSQEEIKADTQDQVDHIVVVRHRSGLCFATHRYSVALVLVPCPARAQDIDADNWKPAEKVSP